MSYNDVKEVVKAGGRYICSTDNGIFIYNADDKSTEVLNSITGLDPSPTTAVAAFDKYVLVGHNNGKFEIIEDNTIYEETSVFNTTNITGSKALLHMDYSGGRLYLSSSFGIVVYDLDKKEVFETYWQLGPGGSTVNVFETVVHDDVIYAVTGGEALAGNISSGVNLLDFNSWKRYRPGSVGAIRKLVVHQGEVYCTVDNEGIFVFRNGEWLLLIDLKGGGAVRSVSSNDISLQYCIDSACFSWQEGNAVMMDIPGAPQMNTFYRDATGQVYAGDRYLGLVMESGNLYNYIAPNGPVSNTIWQLDAGMKEVWMAPGGYDTQFNEINDRSGFSIFKEGTWANLTTQNSGSANLIGVVGGHWMAGKYIIATYNRGIFQYDESGVSPIGGLPFQPSQGILDVYGNEDGMWIVLQDSHIVWLLSNNGEWGQYSLPLSAGSRPKEAHVHGGKIFILADSGSSAEIAVFNRADGEFRYLSTRMERKGVPGNPLCMNTDLEGNLWVGTDNGVAYFSVWGLQNGSDAVVPTIGSRALLAGKEIFDIETDGANRKWFGTNSGAWLVSPDGDGQAAHYHMENSPLLSDKVVEISIVHATGEVFFGTAAGLFSVRGDASKNQFSQNKIKIFPNPVSRGFDGTVGISGLIENTEVKITDVAGRLVWQSTANGGLLGWDLRDYTGKKTGTGVYFVFSISPTGGKRLVGKIAVSE